MATDQLTLAEKLLAYIGVNEPMDTNAMKQMMEETGLPEEKLKMNIDRLNRAGLLNGHLIGGAGHKYFTNVMELRLSYAGVKELKELTTKRESGGNKSIISIGKLNFNLDLNALKVL